MCLHVLDLSQLEILLFKRSVVESRSYMYMNNTTTLRFLKTPLHFTGCRRRNTDTLRAPQVAFLL